MIFSRIFIIGFGLVFAGSSLHAMEILGDEKKLYDFAIVTTIFELHKTSLEKFFDNNEKIKKIDQEYDTIVTNASVEKLSALEQHKLQLQQENTALCMPFLGSLKQELDKNPGMWPDLHVCIESFLQTGQNILDKTPQVKA